MYACMYMYVINNDINDIYIYIRGAVPAPRRFVAQASASMEGVSSPQNFPVEASRCYRKHLEAYWRHAQNRRGRGLGSFIWSGILARLPIWV